MRCKLTYLVVIGYLSMMQLCHAQDPKAVFEQAYNLYESGNYNESMQLIEETQRLLGKTNARIQSLKTLICYERGDTHNALMEIELYFNNSPDEHSSEYENMRTLRKELDETFNAQYKKQRQEIERRRQTELDATSKDLARERASYYFTIAEQAGTEEAFQLFLTKNPTDSLRLLALQYIETVRNQTAYDSLVTEGMTLMKNSTPGEAEQKFLAARRIKSSGELTALLQEATVYAADLALLEVNEALLNKNWDAAIEKLQYVLKVTPTAETKTMLDEARDEKAYELALNNNNPSLMKDYLFAHPNGRRQNQAQGFLFNYYLKQASEYISLQRTEEARAALIKLKELSDLKHWGVFSADYYDLVSAQAKHLTKGPKSFRMANITQAIAYYEELNAESGKNHDTTLKKLKRKLREWNRPVLGYFAYNADFTFNDVGLIAGWNNNHGIGMSVSLRMPKQFIASLHEEESFKLAKPGPLVGSLNLHATKKIIYPLWIYAGGGWAHLEKTVTAPDDPSKVFIPVDSKEVNTVNFESGISIALRPLFLSIGATFPYLTADHKTQLNLTNTPMYFNIGLGFSW